MDVETLDLFLHHLVPGLGCIVALCMFGSPLQAVLTVKQEKKLHDLNPLPMVAIIANCTGWMIYGCLNRDPYVIGANMPGLHLGLFMTLVCYGFADDKVRDSMVAALLFFACLISSSCVYIALAVEERADQIKLAGNLAVLILLIYYAAPLSALAKVLSSRDSASLHWPMSVMCCVNGSLWVAYGLAVGDGYIWGPNAVGAVLGVVQLMLALTFPAKVRAARQDDSADKDNAEYAAAADGERQGLLSGNDHE